MKLTFTQKLVDYSIMFLIYVSYELALYLAKTCGICDPKGYLISAAYVGMNYFVLVRIFLYRNRQQQVVMNGGLRFFFLSNAIVYVSLYLVIDYFRRKWM